jgi:hypothetical protein
MWPTSKGWLRDRRIGYKGKKGTGQFLIFPVLNF